MGETNPGLGGFMSGVMNSNNKDSSSMPPPPIATQELPSMNRPGNNNSANDYRPHFEQPESYKTPIHTSRNQPQQSQQPRSEMRGSDINHILSGLKTKNINIQSDTDYNPNMSDSSHVSISDLKSLQSAGGKLPKSIKRNKSSSNTISLDI